MDNNNNNSKKSLVITLVVLALVIGVSAVIYKVLPKNTNTPGLVMVENDKAEVTKPDSGSTSEEETGEESEGISSEPKRKKAPGFTVEDISGNKVRLSDFRGKPVIINFWASWCGPCKMIGPIIDQIADERTDVKVCKVNVDDEQELAVQFKVMSIPTLLVFKDGKVVNQSLGAKPKTAILAMLD